MVRTVRPNASDTPTKPMPSPGNPAARTALPHPPNTSQKVPNNSAAALLFNGMDLPPRQLEAALETCPPLQDRRSWRQAPNARMKNRTNGTTADNRNECRAGLERAGPA